MSLIKLNDTLVKYTPPPIQYHFLTYFKQNSEGMPICYGGRCTSESAKNIIIQDGMKETPFGTMNFIHGVASSSQWGPGINFNWLEDDPNYTKTHLIQYELIAYPISNGIKSLQNVFNQFIFGFGMNSSNQMIFDTRIQSGGYSVYPANGATDESFYYIGNPGPGNYYGCLRYKVPPNQYVHLCCVLDYQNCKFMYWIDGVYIGAIVVNQYTMSYYTGNLNVLTMVINERATYSQLLVRDAVWTEEKNYDPPIKPYRNVSA